MNEQSAQALAKQALSDKASLQAEQPAQLALSDPGSGPQNGDMAAPDIAADNPLAASASLPEALPTQSSPLPTVDPSLPVEPRVGALAPDFTLETLDGQSLRLADLRGKPVLINYWATWCIPCQAELNLLQRIHQKYQSKGFLVLSVNAIEQDDLAKVQTTVSQYGMTFPVLLDDGGQFAQNYQALFFPTTFFVDETGVIRQVFLGDKTEAEFFAEIEKLLSGAF